MPHVPKTIESKFRSFVKNFLGGIGAFFASVAVIAFFVGGEAMPTCVVSAIIAGLAFWGSASITSVWQIKNVDYAPKNKGSIGA